MTGLPLIDMAPMLGGDEEGRRSFAAALDDACRNIGFAVVRGHGIPAAIVDDLRRAVIDFFDRPLEQKLDGRVSKDNYRGYIPLGFFTPNAAGASDAYEGYKLHRETDPADPICAACALYGPNKWPAAPAGFREAVLAYWGECDRVAGLLLDAFALALDLDPGCFRRAFDEPLTNMTLLHYPPQAPDHDGFGIHAHKDTDALTILAPDPVGGLQVRDVRRRQWISASAPDDALIVNVGDLLEIWSGGRYPSTPHRVINSSGRERYSFPYFAVPRFDVTVSPLLPPRSGFDRGGVRVGDASRAIWYSNWPDAAPIDPRYDPATP